MIRYLLSMGSNLGDRIGNLQMAIHELRGSEIKIERVSSVYETEPWGTLSKSPFLNICLIIDFQHSTYHLLKLLNNIESKMGRKRLEKYGPRPIDIDIIFADDLIISDQELVIPHPRMQYRRFVLVPASEIAPDWKHPVSGKKISQLLTECSDDLTVALKRPLFNAE